MLLNIYSDTSYLSEVRARSIVADHIMLRSNPVNSELTKENSAAYVFRGILKCEVASSAEAGLEALFLNAKEGKILCITVHKLGYKQISTPIHYATANITAIANDTIKKSRSMEMRLFRPFIKSW